MSWLYRTDVMTNRPSDSYRCRSSKRISGCTARAGPGPTAYQGSVTVTAATTTAVTTP